MAVFASRQRGNVTRAQLVQHGVTPAMIRVRQARESLIEIFPGVYLVGHRAEPPHSREYAALLYCAPQALLGRRTAAHVRGWPVPKPADVEVITVGKQLKPRRGLIPLSIGQIDPREAHRHDGMPITSPSLTLLDLGGVLGEDDLARCLNEARAQEVNDGELHATLRAHPNRRGARALAKLLASEESAFAVESEAERLCLKLMIDYGLKPDASQARVGPYRVDFLYERERLIVEVDGYRFHRTKQRFVRDRRRRAELMARGYEVFVVTWSDLTNEAEATMRRLRAVRDGRRALALGAMRAQRADSA